MAVKRGKKKAVLVAHSIKNTTAQESLVKRLQVSTGLGFSAVVHLALTEMAERRGVLTPEKR